MTPVAGVHRWDGTPQALAADLRDGDWAYAHLDGAGAGTRREVLVALGEALGFPGWYGANLDALWDCLRDLVDPVVLVWDDWATAAGSDPDGFASVVRVLVERAEAAGDLSVLLHGDGPELDPGLGVDRLS